MPTPTQLHDFGKPSAAKRGRNPAYPYVPVIDYGAQAVGIHRTRTEQIRGRAFKTRDEAMNHAALVIAARRADLECKLADPRYRALRAQYDIAE